MRDAETAADRVARVHELQQFALARLPTLQRADGVFCHQQQAGQRPQGRSLRYTLIVLLGLLRTEGHGIEHGFHLGALRSRVLSELGAEELTAGDFGLALWAESRAGGGAVGELVEALIARRRRVEALPSSEVAWVVTGLTEAGAGGELGRGEELLRDFRAQLVRTRRPRGGLVSHSGRRARRRLPDFADQIYSVLALTQLARVRDDREAAEAAQQIGELLLECQMPNGAWPCFYDPLRGRVVEPYELFSVHQDSLALIALHGLTEASGEERYREAAIRGLDWNYGGNELGVQMLDREAGFLYRAIRRKTRFQRTRAARTAAAAYLRSSPRSAAPQELELDRSMRPYHLGWILEAWSGREELAARAETA